MGGPEVSTTFYADPITSQSQCRCRNTQVASSASGELALMKRSAVLINVGARRDRRHQAALYRALADNAIAGAALDVWYRYPTDGNATLLVTTSFPAT